MSLFKPLIFSGFFVDNLQGIELSKDFQSLRQF